MLLCRAAATIATIRRINGQSVVENLPEELWRISKKEGGDTATLGRKGPSQCEKKHKTYGREP